MYLTVGFSENVIFTLFSSKCQMKLSWFKGVGGGGGGGAGQDAFAGVSFHVEAQARFFFVSFDAMCQLTHTEPKLMPCAR